MTHETQSAMSSPASISGVLSISDVDSTSSVEDKAIIPGTPGNIEGGPFDLGDGDLSILANGITLETHKYLIKRFSGLKNRIRNNTITLECSEPGVEDFRNTFKVLYASVFEGPFHFDPVILTSALRIATTYDHPSLRKFAINHLEQASLSAVERIRLAREFGLSSWEEPAYVELCNRDEALTKEEASVLGLDAFVHVARIREKEQRRRGKEVDPATESDDECQAGEEPATKANAARGGNKKAKKSSLATPDSKSGKGEKDQDISTKNDEKGEVGTKPKPSFMEVETVGTYWRSCNYNTWMLEAPGCECHPQKINKCGLPPCIASAIKHLQTQDITHNTNISKLESTMEHVQATLTALATPKPHAEPDSVEPIQTGCVEKEVRKWLAGAEIHAGIA